MVVAYIYHILLLEILICINIWGSQIHVEE